ncbi:MAG: hypothetical protein Q7S58_14180 [Candidatus Binatus sp.]|uniref:hypothetical protein n=1 Tax=Candidatus Binatus sp. TaxID=2811406 RepID=UPI00271A3905|nr:hypothetical protein [Candidatus Binatus sp.]MDO8433549.1 hypothetical protein [Candidatus Binatus sp.]
MSPQVAEAVAFDLQRAIEPRPHIFHRDGRRQIDDLLCIEVALQFLEHLIGNVHRAERHFLRVAQRRALSRREERILDVVADRGDFFVADSSRAATGSIDVDSEHAADHLRRTQTDEPLQLRVRHLRCLDRLREDGHRDGEAGSIRPRAEGVQYLVHPALHYPDERLEHPVELIFFKRFDTHD